jgi:5-(carboxyamino)imidazole ribonucleotide mutase
VGVLLGSIRDLERISPVGNTLDLLGIAYEQQILSAHRAPHDVADYAETARKRGLKVIICASGLSAHLAGSVAARTTLPVIGLPLSSGSLGGLDALLSTVQMPTGVPVATVAIDGAKNAAFLAAEIIALSDPGIEKKLADARDRLAQAPGHPEP